MATKYQIWVLVRDGGSRWKGRLRPGRADAVRVVFDDGDGPMTLPLASTVEIGFATLGMPAAVRSQGRLVQLERLRDGAIDCAFEVEVPDLLQRGAPGAVVDTTRGDRQWVRVETGKDEIPVPVILPDEPPATQRLLATLRDGSAGGLGLVFPLAAEPRLAKYTSFKAAVAWPGYPGEREWTCDVRSRTLLGDEVRYGVQFCTEMSDQAPAGPRIEMLWDCPGCHRTGLLNDSHAFCPACGHVRTGPPRKPVWGDAASRDIHPFGAADGVCPACASVVSSTSVFCPGCGAQL